MADTVRCEEGEIQFRAGNNVRVTLTGIGLLQLKGEQQVTAVLEVEEMRKLAVCLLAKSGPTDEDQQPKPLIRRALMNLKEVLAETRGKHGRDFIRKLPQGKLLDALDANRECGFIDDRG